jgi:hypothetical protein
MQRIIPAVGNMPACPEYSTILDPRRSDWRGAPARVFSTREENTMNEHVRLDGNRAIDFDLDPLPAPRPIIILDMRPADEDDPIRPRDRGAIAIWIGLGALCGAIWTACAWAIWSAFS